MIAISNSLIRRSQLVAVLIAVAATVTTATPAQAIITRHDVDDAKYLQDDRSYQAVFDVFDQRGGVATLIAPRWALTVAHVGQDIPQGHQVTIAGQSFVVGRTILHPNWETKMLEMALLELDKPVQGVDPIPPYEEGDEQGRIVTFVGRGDTGTGLTGPVTRDHRLRAATNRAERVEGDMLVFRFDAPGDENVTPLEGISGPGDSGGPALIGTAEGIRIAGLSVASSGRPKGRYGIWEFYSRVSPELTWIRDTIMATGDVEPFVTPGSPAGGDVEPVVTVKPPPDGEVESKRPLGFEIALYAGIPILAALALVALVWWQRGLRRSRLQ